MAAKRTVTSVWGVDAANELAAIAIDLLCDAPEERANYGRHSRTLRRMGPPRALVAWDLIEEGREILERHDIRWRAIKGDNERTV